MQISKQQLTIIFISVISRIEQSVGSLPFFNLLKSLILFSKILVFHLTQYLPTILAKNDFGLC